MYSFVLAGLLVVMGNLGDRIGRRRLLLRQRTVAMSVLSVGGTGVPRSSMWRKAHQDVC
jgi:MFS family permease